MKKVMIRRPIQKKWYMTAVIGMFVLLFGIWFLLTEVFHVSEIFLPSPIDVVGNVIERFQQNTIQGDIGISLYRILAGFIIAAVIAIPLGVLVGLFKIFEGLLQPLCEFIRYMPVPAFLPLIMVYAGIGEAAKIAVVFMGIFFQMVLMVADDVRKVPEDYLNVGYTVGASHGKVVFHVLVPAMLPDLMNTIRILIGWAWTYVTVAELVAANNGLGYSILKAQRFLKTDSIFAGILIIGLLGLVTDRILYFITKKCFPWAGGESK